MGHAAETPTETNPIDEATPRPYDKTKMSTRARPQYDPAEIGRKYLEEMEKGGRLHLQRKKDA